MTDKNTSNNSMIFSNSEESSEKLKTLFGKRFSGRKCCLVAVADNAIDIKAFKVGVVLEGAINRVLIVFMGHPIDLSAMEAWREWAVSRVKAWDVQMDFVSGEPADAKWREVIEKNCEGWFVDPPQPERPGIQRKEWVMMPEAKTAKDDPSLLSMMFGSMGELLNEVDIIARRFRSAVSEVKDSDHDNYLASIDKLLAAKGGGATAKKSPATPKGKSSAGRSDLGIGNVTDQLPKLLLRGDTGVGKTLIASYLHRQCGAAETPLHISIPEYLAKEDMFEYALFGYAAGNYTGGKKEGDHGLLLQNVCRVVFLDEIGEANAAIQAKLLTFMDHYRVRPRGWLGDPFYCPVLIVAATNRDLEEEVAGKPVFRRDLLARFTHKHRIPSLKDRKGDFPFILDCLLQRESMNPGGKLTEIGQDALEYLLSLDYREGNFRELEDRFRHACEKALRDGRTYLVKSDFS